MVKTCIAIDIGASSGRIIEGILNEDRIYIKEVYRFKNNMTIIDGHYCWDIDNLFNEIIKGLASLRKNVCVESIGIDTWAVDYALLDDKNIRISPVFAYRDHRTDNTMDKLFKKINPGLIYGKTGIQFQQFNTIYQLYEHVKTYKKIAYETETFLMVPDYLNFLLSGEKAIEFTNATSTQLYNVHEHQWDEELINLTGMDKKIFSTVVKPGTVLGTLKDEIKGQTGLGNVKVIAPATHDTGSAVVSVPADYEDFAYISSGTWSLMGIESKTPICTEEARKYNFTNEGGAFDTYRVLKNIMGLWLIQEVQRLYANKYSFADLVLMAEQAEPFKSIINPDSPRFLNPQNMINEIQSFCKETGQPVPETPGEIARCIFESLAYQYRKVLLELRKIQDKAINKIHIIGGGSQNKLLNQLCADFTNCEVYTGPIEATAIGNLAVQFIALGEIESIVKARKMISKSFDVEKYVPKSSVKIEENWNKFRRFCDVR